MPFNGSGTFSIVNTFVPGTTILSASVNQNFSDIATGLSDCLTRDGQAGMEAQLKAISGTAGAPSYTFTASANTGIYLPASSQIGFATGGALAMALTTTALVMSVPQQFGAEVTKASATTCLIFDAASQNVAISGTTAITSFNNTGSTAAAGEWRICRATGAFLLTSGANILGLPGNVTTAAGDVFYVRCEGAGVSRIMWYSRVSGAPLYATITPTAIAGNTNDYAPTSLATAEVVRVSASAAYNVTGLLALDVGRTVTLVNVGSFNITLTANDTNSSSANRFLFSYPVVLYPGMSLQLIYDSTSGGWRQFERVVTQPVAAGFKNLVITVASDTNVGLTADALTLENAAGLAYRASSVNVTANITVSGANGLDTGAEASNTWYAFFVIYNPTTNTQASLLSTSATSPTLPSGYTFYARFGWVRNDGSSNLWRTLQRGRDATIVVGTNPASTPIVSSGVVGTYSDTSPTLSSVSLASFVPTTAGAADLSAFTKWTDGAEGSVLFAPNTAFGGTNGGPRGSRGNIYPFTSVSGTARISSTVRVLLETQAFALTTSSAGCAVAIMGWQDNL